MYFTDGNTLFEAASGNTIINNQGTNAVTDFITAADSIEFATGTLFIQDDVTALTITSNNGTVTVNSIDGDHDEDVTINAGSGALSVGRIGGDNGTDDEGINTVQLTSSHATGITLSGNITTSDAANNNITLTGPVVISGTVALDTDPGSTQDGTITFTSTIRGDGDAATTDNLDIETGSGTLTFNASTIIGGADKPLATLDVNITGGTGNVVALDIPQIGKTGTTTAGVTGITRIGSTTATTVTMSDDLYNFGTGDVTISAVSTGTGTTFSAADTNVNTGGGAVTINNKLAIGDGTLDINTTGGNIEITGAITGAAGNTDGNEALILDDGTGNGTITLGSTVGSGDNIQSLTIISTGTAVDSVKLGGNIKTSDQAGSISITGPVTLTADVAIDADAAATTVTFATTSTVNATSAGGQGLTIDTGAGNISMGGALGGTTSLKDLTINSTTTAVSYTHLTLPTIYSV